MDKKDKRDFQKRKKIKLTVKRDFQLWIIIRIVAASLVAIIIASLLSYIYAKNAVEADYLKFQVYYTRTVSEVFLPIFLATTLTSIVIGLLLILLLPLKITGPIYRIEQDLKQIGSGDLSKTINIRARDIHKELVETINMTVAEIDKMVRDVKESGNTLAIKIDEGKIDEIQNALKLHKKQLERIITKP